MELSYKVVVGIIQGVELKDLRPSREQIAITMAKTPEGFAKELGMEAHLETVVAHVKTAAANWAAVYLECAVSDLVTKLDPTKPNMVFVVPSEVGGRLSTQISFADKGIA